MHGLNATKMTLFILAVLIVGCLAGHCATHVSDWLIAYVSDEPSFPLFIGAHVVVFAPVVLIAAVAFDLSEGE